MLAALMGSMQSVAPRAVGAVVGSSNRPSTNHFHTPPPAQSSQALHNGKQHQAQLLQHVLIAVSTVLAALLQGRTGAGLPSLHSAGWCHGAVAPCMAGLHGRPGHAQSGWPGAAERFCQSRGDLLGCACSVVFGAGLSHKSHKGVLLHASFK